MFSMHKNEEIILLPLLSNIPFVVCLKKKKMHNGCVRLQTGAADSGAQAQDTHNADWIQESYLKRVSKSRAINYICITIFTLSDTTPAFCSKYSIIHSPSVVLRKNFNAWSNKVSAIGLGWIPSPLKIIWELKNIYITLLKPFL